MKISKIFAGLAAAAVAASVMALSAFAVPATDYVKDGTVFINADKEDDPNWTADSGVAITDVYGVTYHVTFNADEVANDSTWIGGGIGANSNSTGWYQKEWGRNEKEIIADLDNGTITWLSDSPVFKADDAYAQFWLQTWGGTVTINGADILGAGGTILSDDSAPAAAEPEETEAETDEASDETEAEVSEDEDAEVVEEEVEAEVVEEDAEPVEVVEDAEPVAVAETEAVVVETAPAVEDVAPVADVATAPVKTGNTAAATIAVVMVAAGAAAVISKRK